MNNIKILQNKFSSKNQLIKTVCDEGSKPGILRLFVIGIDANQNSTTLFISSLMHQNEFDFKYGPNFTNEG